MFKPRPASPEAQAVKLRLYEAAAQLPAVRKHTDPTESAQAASAVVGLWYNEIVSESSGAKAPSEGQPGLENLT